MPFTYRKSRMRRFKRRYKRKRARKAVDRRQNRQISKLYRKVSNLKAKKYVDQGNNQSVANNWINFMVRDLTYIAQGTTENTRNGNKIKILSHHIKMLVSPGDGRNFYRFMVIRFATQATANVQISDALQTPIAGSPFHLLTFLKRNTDAAYQILYDTGVKRLEGNAATTAPLSGSSQKVHNIKLNGPYWAAYSGASAGDVVQGFTYIIGATDSAIAPHPSFATNVRTIFSG